MSNHRRAPLPIHVFIGEAPPAELVEAAARGECIVASGDRPRDIPRWGVFVASLVDLQIAKEDEAAAARLGELTLTQSKGG